MSMLPPTRALNSALSVVKGSSCTVTVAFWGPL